MHRVVVASPSSVVNENYPPDGQSAWTLAGQPIPFARQLGGRAGHWIDLFVPYLPVNPDLFLYGLSPSDDDDAARAGAWPQLIADIAAEP